MSFAVFLPLLISLGLFLVPVWLLGRPDAARLQNALVSPRYTPPQAIRNSSIAYALRLAAFAPVLVLGATGSFWPVAMGAASFGFGIYLIYVLRPRIFAFLEEALEQDRSITVHAFIARLCGDDRRVRVFAAGLTLFVLVAVITFEALAVFGFCKLLVANDSLARGLAFSVLVLGAIYGLPAGHPAAMYTGQLQLGAIFLGLFGTSAFLLYQHVSALTPLPPYATFAIVFAAAYAIAVLIYRHSRYIETGRIDPASRAAGLLSKFGKVLNPVISAFAVLLIVLAGMEFVASAPAAATAPAESNLSLATFAALALLPLFYPLADIVHWQRLAAIEKNKENYAGDTARWLKAMQAIFGLYAVEIVLLWLFVASLGTIAAGALDVSDGTAVIQALIAEAGSGNNPIAAAAFSLLLLAAVAFATSTMASSFAAGLCTIRYDILPPSKDISSSLAGRAFFLAIVIALIVATETLSISFFSGTFLALVFALCSPVLPFAPLIIAGQNVSLAGALVVLAAGPVCTATALIGYAITGNDAWLWGAAPVCVLLSFGLSLAGLYGRRMR